jgi:hypothetical protein
VKQTEGAQLKLLKFHGQLHYVDDIKWFGLLQNSSGSPCEASLEQMAEHPAQVMQC